MGPFSPTLEKARSDENDTTVWVQFNLLYTIVKLLTKGMVLCWDISGMSRHFLAKRCELTYLKYNYKMLCSQKQHGTESEITGPTGRQELCCTNVAMQLLGRLSLCLTSKSSCRHGLRTQLSWVDAYKVCGKLINLTLWDRNCLSQPE